MDGGFLSCSKGRKEATRMEQCCYSGKKAVFVLAKALAVVLRD